MKKKILLTALVALLFAGCSSTPINDAPAPSAAAAGGNEGLDLDLLRSDSLLTQRSIYFDFNKYEVKAEYQDIVNAHAKYIADHPNAKATLKGHADYHGSHEYNLALGQKRSVSVKNVMNLKGASDSQIETVSFGEEEANQNCQGSQCDKDRRVDISYDVE